MVKTHNDNVRVMVRVRPFNQKEKDEVGGGCPPCTLSVPSETLITCIDPARPDLGEHTFPFDYVFWSIPPDQVPATVPVADQELVYEHIGVPQLNSLFEGYNGCIFAYGQTSSGKTHSMMGWPGTGRGVTPRLCEEMFNRIEALEAQRDGLKRTTYSVKVSFLEIYNEKVQDLLSKKGSELKIAHDPQRGPVVRGLSEHPVSSWSEVERYLDKGMDHRTTAATAMNDRSSRSHAVVILSVDMDDNLGMVGGKSITRTRRARANLVDLAGSEKVAKSKVEGAHLKEAIGINQSLTCLGRVIDGLVEQKPHIPYRDSVLTCLLQDSLGGNSRTAMLAALSPAQVNYDETMSTLRYAARARKVVNKVKINEDPAAALIRELQEELERMRRGDFGDMDMTGRDLVSAAEIEARQAEVQEALGKLRELEAREAEAEREREQQWQNERADINEKHLEALSNLRKEQEELEAAKQELEAEHGRMTDDIRTKRQMFTIQKMKHGAQLSIEKQKRKQTEEHASRVKSALIRDKFNVLASKARLSELTEEANDEKVQRFKKLTNILERDLSEANMTIAELEGLPDWIDAEGAAQYDEYGRLLGPDGKPLEEVVYDGPLCDMCMEQPAQFRCLQAPCLGDLYCVWCDANQHRYEFKDHDRMPIAMPCECCGAREAEVICPGCDGARMCRMCDDKQHNRHERTLMFGLPCHFCGLRDAQVECFDCPSRLCPACDELKHRNMRRLEHRRQYIENPLALRTTQINPPQHPPVEPYPALPHTAASLKQYALEYHDRHGISPSYPHAPSTHAPGHPGSVAASDLAASHSRMHPPMGASTAVPAHCMATCCQDATPRALPHNFPGSQLTPQGIYPIQPPAALTPDQGLRQQMDLARENALIASHRPVMQAPIQVDPKALNGMFTNASPSRGPYAQPPSMSGPPANNGYSSGYQFAAQPTAFPAANGMHTAPTGYMASSYQYTGRTMT